MLYFPADPRGVPTPKEFARLAARIKSGSARQRLAARNELVERNLGLAITLTRSFRKALPRHDEEFISEAVFGLMDAADKFDPAKGTFASIAGPHVHRRCVEYMKEKIGTIKIPGDTHDLLKSGKSPDSESVKAAKKLQAPVFSFTTFRDADGRNFYDQLVDVSLPEPWEQAAQREASETLALIIDGMDRRQSSMLRRRHGLGCESETYEQLAKRHGKVKEWARAQFRNFIYPELKKKLAESGIAG